MNRLGPTLAVVAMRHPSILKSRFFSREAGSSPRLIRKISIIMYSFLGCVTTKITIRGPLVKGH
jgi:hypothetical protein